MILNLIQYLRDRLIWVIRVCCALLALLVIYDVFLLDKSKAHTAAETLPGFWSLFGLVSCVVIIFVSKWFGKLGITKSEDYYDR